jgi:hypothetical protein
MFPWENNSYRLVSVRCEDNGVRVTSFAGFIPPAIEGHYRAQGFHVPPTRVVTELPDIDRTGRSRGMKKLREPMYVTTVTWPAR